MADSWTDRIQAVGQNLLTMEINTVVAPGLSAQKMPEVPIALHTIVFNYSIYVADAGFQVTAGLLQTAALRIGGVGASATPQSAGELLRYLQLWPFIGRRYTADEDANLADLPLPPPPSGQGLRAAELTNGAESFEALQWAAWAGMQHVRANGQIGGRADTVVLARIYANCRQLKEAAVRLEQQHPPPSWSQRKLAPRLRRFSAASFPDRLASAGGAGPAADAPTNLEDAGPRLFGGTVEQTARALFDNPRPVFSVDPDVTVLIRKVWDVGVQRVCLQTVMQVDGDIVQVIGENMRPEEREFLTGLHRQAVRESMAQWRAMFELLADLVGAVGKAIFRA